MTIKTLMTADELLHMPHEDMRYELIEGELIEMSPAMPEHAWHGAEIGFALAFVLLAASTALIGMGLGVGDYSVLVFLPRLIAFLIIIAAIVDKNRRSRAG